MCDARKQTQPDSVLHQHASAHAHQPQGQAAVPQQLDQDSNKK
jgi:hypothetical protein